MEEKEAFLSKKTKQLQDLTEEKGTLAGEIRDMKDMHEVKERKINVLQKKVGLRKAAIISFPWFLSLFILSIYLSIYLNNKHTTNILYTYYFLL